MPTQGPRGVLAGGNTTTSIVLSTALPAAVAPNQLANKGNSNGFKIRIIGNSAGGSGKTEIGVHHRQHGRHDADDLSRRAALVHAAGWRCVRDPVGPVVHVERGHAGCWLLEVLRHRHQLDVGQPLHHEPARDLEHRLQSSWLSMSRTCRSTPILAMGYFGNLTATATAATSITGQAAGGDAAVLANEYRNFQIRIVQDTVNPTAVGQRRNITSHTAGASPVYTVPAWTVTPSANAVFVIENNGDRILYWGSAQQQPRTRTTSRRTPGTPPRSPTRSAAHAAGSINCPSFFMRPDAAKQARHSYVYVFRGGAGAVMDLFDIAGGATGAVDRDRRLRRVRYDVHDRHHGDARSVHWRRAVRVHQRERLAAVLEVRREEPRRSRPRFICAIPRARRRSGSACPRRCSWTARRSSSSSSSSAWAARSASRWPSRSNAMSLLLLFGGRTIEALTGWRSARASAPLVWRCFGAWSVPPLAREPATGRLARVLPVAGLAAGGGTVSGALRVARALRGIAAASGTVAARLAVVRRLAGVAAGSATLGAQLARVRPLAGEASGTSTVLGRASCVRSLAGVAAGWSRVSGFMLSSVGTPASRTLRVRREARTLRPAFEDRCSTVRREARVLVPAAEDRTIHPRAENRSIDA